MLDDNIFAEPAKSASVSVCIEDYNNLDIIPDTNLGVAYYSSRNGRKLFLNASVYSDEVKKPKLKINEKGDALLYLDTVDYDGMNDFDKYESTILFEGLNNLSSEKDAVIDNGEVKNLTMADLIENNDDFKISVISRNKEKREDGKLIGKKYKYNFATAEVVRSQDSEKYKDDDDLEFFSKIDLDLNKETRNILNDDFSQTKNKTFNSRKKTGNLNEQYYLCKNGREK